MSRAGILIQWSFSSVAFKKNVFQMVSAPPGITSAFQSARSWKSTSLPLYFGSCNPAQGVVLSPPWPELQCMLPLDARMRGRQGRTWWRGCVDWINLPCILHHLEEEEGAFWESQTRLRDRETGVASECHQPKLLGIPFSILNKLHGGPSLCHLVPV